MPLFRIWEQNDKHYSYNIAISCKLISTMYENDCFFSTDAISFHSRDYLPYCLIVMHNSYLFQYFLLVHSWSLLEFKISNSYYTCIVKSTTVSVYEKYNMAGMSKEKYSTRQSWVLYLSQDITLSAVYFLHTRQGSVLTVLFNLLYLWKT